MAAPEYLICLECETPCYTFEWKDGKIVEILCYVCGNDEIDSFLSEEELEALEDPEE
ncbi:MAG: hypothetical protein KDD47_13585 [Acidobacteria bacterium]|nr:hypothetical protein [Acidobacteriota bacterium]